MFAGRPWLHVKFGGGCSSSPVRTLWWSSVDDNHLLQIISRAQCKIKVFLLLFAWCRIIQSTTNQIYVQLFTERTKYNEEKNRYPPQHAMPVSNSMLLQSAFGITPLLTWPVGWRCCSRSSSSWPSWSMTPTPEGSVVPRWQISPVIRRWGPSVSPLCLIIFSLMHPSFNHRDSSYFGHRLIPGCGILFCRTSRQRSHNVTNSFSVFWKRLKTHAFNRSFRKSPAVHAQYVHHFGHDNRSFSLTYFGKPWLNKCQHKSLYRWQADCRGWECGSVRRSVHRAARQLAGRHAASPAFDSSRREPNARSCHSEDTRSSSPVSGFRFRRQTGTGLCCRLNGKTPQCIILLCGCDST